MCNSFPDWSFSRIHRLFSPVPWKTIHRGSTVLGNNFALPVSMWLISVILFSFLIVTLWGGSISLSFKYCDGAVYCWSIVSLISKKIAGLQTIVNLACHFKPKISTRCKPLSYGPLIRSSCPAHGFSARRPFKSLRVFDIMRFYIMNQR